MIGQRSTLMLMGLAYEFVNHGHSHMDLHRACDSFASTEGDEKLRELAAELAVLHKRTAKDNAQLAAKLKDFVIRLKETETAHDH